MSIALERCVLAMLRRFSLCMLVGIMLMAFTMADSSIWNIDSFDYTLTEEGVVITKWREESEVEIPPILYLPANLGGQPVVGIAKDALSTTWLEPYGSTFEIVIPEGVLYLEERAFEDCGYVTTIYLPSSLSDIDENCFANVSAEIVFPNGNSNFLIKNGFLIDLRSATLLYAAPSSCVHSLPCVERLGSRSIDNWLCEKTEVCLPATLKSIGRLVFCDLPDLSRITFADSIEQIDSGAFWGTELREIVLPSELIEIPAYCFSDCSITSIIIPDGVTYIGEYAIYRNWETLATVTLPATVQFVGYRAFPEETQVIALSPDTHFETTEEYKLRCPDGKLW